MIDEIGGALIEGKDKILRASRIVEKLMNRNDIQPFLKYQSASRARGFSLSDSAAAGYIVQNLSNDVTEFEASRDMVGARSIRF